MKNDDFENFKKTEDRFEGQTYFYRLKMTEKCRKTVIESGIIIQRKLNRKKF